MISLVDAQETIVAIASPTSPAIRGVVRLSGQDVESILNRLGIETVVAPDSGKPAWARRFDTEVDVGLPIGKVPLSLLWWPTNKSYTGQPSAEFHTFGSLPILTALVEAAISSGARPARPGEFTMRAFLAGRLDLTQAEAVLGVIEAEQRGSLDHALRQLAGNLSRPLEAMRSDVLDLLADVEAGLDFVDEDIEFISDHALIERLGAIGDQLESTWRVIQQRGGGSARPVIALRGEPNAGKSCLMNCLAGVQAAIVADVPGTTRDVVTTEAFVAGHAVTLVDTAGIEDGSNDVDRHSQEQARRASEQARVRLWCVDRSRPDFEEAVSVLRAVAAQEQRDRVIDLWVATKRDIATKNLTETEPDPLRRRPAHSEVQQQDEPSVQWIPCSAVTGHGIDQLRQAIDLALSRRDAEETGSVVGTAARCSDSLRRARAAVSAAIRLTEHAEGHEFVATELRTVAQCLGEVTGAVYTDDILDRVFSRFCIGK